MFDFDLRDYHIHTNNTDDGKATLLEMAAAAAKRGVAEIAVTDHYIHGIPGYCVGPEVIERHFKDAAEAKSRYDITVLVGLEVDFFQPVRKEIERMLDSFDFDIIIGSAHIVDGLGLASDRSAAAYFRRFDPAKAFSKYFDRLVETIESGLFDIIGHLDIVRKFAPEAGADLPFEQYEHHAARAADALLATGAGFEINCRGFDHGPAEQYPSSGFLELLAGNGISKVTIGSDAHETGVAGIYLDRGLEAAREAGITQMCRFSKRKAHHYDI